MHDLIWGGGVWPQQQDYVRGGGGGGEEFEKCELKLLSDVPLTWIEQACRNMLQRTGIYKWSCYGYFCVHVLNLCTLVCCVLK